MQLKAEHLAALNLVLEVNPDLKALVIQKVTLAITGLDQLRAAIGPEAVKGPEPQTVTPQVQSPGQADELEPKILGWFQTHTGKHALAEVRKDLDVPQTSKPFKTAVARLLDDKRVEWSGKRGVAAVYWLGKGK